MTHPNYKVAITPKGYWIGPLPMSGTDRLQLHVNDLKWLNSLDNELGYDRFGSLEEIQPKLIEFAKRYDLKIITVNGRTGKEVKHPRI